MISGEVALGDSDHFNKMKTADFRFHQSGCPCWLLLPSRPQKLMFYTMSTSNSKRIVEDDEEEEFEHFDDFTLASSWERFISEIEAVCRQWLADGPKNLLVKDAVQINHLKDLYKVKSEFKYAMKSYCMEYYFAPSDDGKGAHWDQTLHDLQLCFGVKEFLVIAPQSANGVVLDAPEASKLLSAVAIALSNCSWFGCYVS
ncbi:UNVERIFIED_CONTAM: hypothetical protein Sradi_1998700 [Sesamum radiatum]|uniref:Rab3 GTPase-activating protein catalytic subunit n=1 Tax=Sesamum radiatum TaxID=300843 RepID=A0AAW2TGK9_SESRA